MKVIWQAVERLFIIQRLLQIPYIDLKVFHQRPQVFMIWIQLNEFMVVV